MGNRMQREVARITTTEDSQKSDGINRCGPEIDEAASKEVSIKAEYSRIRRKMILLTIAPIAAVLTIFFFNVFEIFSNILAFLTIPFALALAFLFTLLLSLSYLPFVIFKNSKFKILGFFWFSVTFFILFLIFSVNFGGWEYSRGEITIPRNSIGQMTGIFGLAFVWLVVRATLIFDKCDSKQK